jgi:hypothetical protein
MPNQPRAPLNDDGTCTRCGELHTKCVAHRKKDGRPCGRNPAPGCDVCQMHGAGSAKVRAAGQRRLAAAKLERQAAATLDLVDVQEITDPLGLLLDVLAEIRAYQLFLANHVAELGTELTGLSKDDVEHVRALVAAYERALERTAKVAALVVKLNIEERLMRVREDQVRLLESALLATCAELGVRVDDDATRTALARNLRVIDGGQSAV